MRLSDEDLKSLLLIGDETTLMAQELLLARKVIDSVVRYKRESQHPVPDLSHRVFLRNDLFKSLEAYDKGTGL